MKIINNHNHNYYDLDKNLISDFEYDKLLNELVKLESKHRNFMVKIPLQIELVVVCQINSTRISYFSNVSWIIYSSEELESWYTRVVKILNTDNFEFCCELKYDGASVNLMYEDGKLLRALTRGDGTQGDNITNNIKTIRSVPIKLNNTILDKFEIRGEIIRNDSFEKLNEREKLRRAII